MCVPIFAQLNTELQYEKNTVVHEDSPYQEWNNGSRSRNRGQANIGTIYQALACTAQQMEPSTLQPCVTDIWPYEPLSS